MQHATHPLRPRLPSREPRGIRGGKTATCTLLAALLLAPASAAERSFADLSIEELMNESVTSVSKRETRLGDSPDAVTVITQEEIQRSGHRSIAELLRLVPGLDVARVHANEWAITGRGFNGQYANKLLVLIDGRSVYSPMFAGVYWNSQDVILDHLDRIEVIRGPGASLWGANAVNGVINVTTKQAKETQGGVITTSFGNDEPVSTSVSYGGQLGSDVYYRTFVKYFDHSGFAEPRGKDAPDAWDMLRFGTRVDWEPSFDDLLTLQGEYYTGAVGEHFDGVSLTPPFTVPVDLIHHNYGGNVLGRWTRQLSPASDFTVQAYYDRFHQWDGDIAETRDTIDLDFNHRFAATPRHEIVWGVNYRYTADRLTPTFYLSFTPERERSHLLSGFVQDEVTLVPKRLSVTLGVMVQRHPHVGVEVQPSARVLWTPTRSHTGWLALSHSVRTPSRYDRDSRINAAAFQTPSGPTMLVALLGNRDAASEELNAYEAGYRAELGRGVSLDTAIFYQRYDGILAFVPGDVAFESDPAPAHLVMPLHFKNANSGHSYGSEVSLQWRVNARWKLAASHSWLHMRLRPDPTPETESPTHQFQLRSYFDLSRTVQLNAAWYHVGSIETPRDNDHARVDAIDRLDLGLTWRLRPALEIGVWGQNLLDRRHPEFGSFKTNTLAEIPRSFSARLTWRF